MQRHALATLLRVAAGFGFGVVAGTVAGAITGYSALVQRLLDPTLQALRAIPSIAWVPLFMLWFGIFEASKIILISVGVFFPVYLGVMGAVHVGRSQARRGRPGVPAVGLRDGPAHSAAGGAAGLCDFAARGPWPWLDVRRRGRVPRRLEGLGYLLIDGQQLGKPAQIVAAIVAFAIIGKTTDWILGRGTRRSCAGKTASRVGGTEC